MAQPQKAPQVGTIYPVRITLTGGSYSVPANEQDISINDTDTVAFTAYGGDCMLSFTIGAVQPQPVPLALIIPANATINLRACVLDGTVNWTPGTPTAAGASRNVATTPYKIKVGSGAGEPHPKK